MVLIVSIVVLVLLALWIISLYNSLVKLRNNRENAFADIDVQLKQRHDLIPQLVSTVKGYAAHEKDTLERVINARNGAMGAHTIDEKIKAENALSSAGHQALPHPDRTIPVSMPASERLPMKRE